MSCWRVLQLSDEVQGETVPQLLIKTQFGSSSYTVFLTDLSNIWSEELDLSCIVRRASDVESPIENSLTDSDDTSRTISRDKSDNVMLHTTISLPEPLDLLTWKFCLIKRPAATLKNELILPLLVSAHVQHVRISRLLAVISDKDRAITRLVDQYESSNLDLAAAFPSIGNTKSGRRLVKREQAARYIPGLQSFDPDTWKKDTAEMVGPDVSTFGLFQEALFECTPKIPPKLKSDDDEDNHWWKDLETSASVFKRAATTKTKTQPKKAPAPARPAGPDSETEDEETEDEFETHENFKSRDLTNGSEPPATREPASKNTHQDVDIDDTTAEGNMDVDKDEDDGEDLDVPSKVQSRGQHSPPRRKAPTPGPSPPKTVSPIRADSPPAKPKARGFKIGGGAKKTELQPVASPEETSKSTPQNERIPTRSKVDEIVVGSKPMKKGFKIGGKSKMQTAAATEEMTSSEASRPQRDTSTTTPSSSIGPSASTTTKVEKQTLPVEEEREETEEEKVERKRRELKRKNEELAKKQAQSKKKKRF
ncbi:uncharacterized protein N0V89_007204 [Didymosphaeria variabile]|uniref:Non-homologous end-joining factor 1 n=1 Tax=Didymosphaeria variabile TaxID=1932322 RepID=A0A9W8XL06_9PLEO|nr:uncharacterized protein N0V89_007204 [Didymosphaeria variabile]KAJ4351860.1 hypothetical protein N0V89_007204 [Didymosphaeria variabile]